VVFIPVHDTRKVNKLQLQTLQANIKNNTSKYLIVFVPCNATIQSFIYTNRCIQFIYNQRSSLHMNSHGPLHKAMVICWLPCVLLHTNICHCKSSHIHQRFIYLSSIHPIRVPTHQTHFLYKLYVQYVSHGNVWLLNRLFIVTKDAYSPHKLSLIIHI
jgi:hypothetical protein